MSSVAKAVLVVLSTFAIGVVVGALLDAALARDRVEQVRQFRGGRNLAGPLERVIEPTDEAQREAIREVLERAAERHEAIFERTFEEMWATMDSVRAELDPLLTDEQRARLDRFGPGRDLDRFGPGRDWVPGDGRPGFRRRPGAGGGPPGFRPENRPRPRLRGRPGQPDADRDDLESGGSGAPDGTAGDDSVSTRTRGVIAALH